MKKSIRKHRVLARLVRTGMAVGCVAALSFSAYGGDVIGKVVVGYQGWLSAPNDGSLVSKWKHTNMECWPDVREYTTTYSGCTFYQAGVLQPAYNGNLGNGQPAKMFSNWNDQTVNKHFEWMQQYDIDCAAVQRFGSELSDSRMKAYRDGIATKVRTAAQTYGRKYYIMYDISGWTTFQADIKTDWTKYMKTHTNSSAYAKENGKPVVCIWGIGFSDRPGNVTSWTDVVNWFKGQGCYVIGGVSGKFNTDTTNKNAYKACNMLMAWRVGSTLNPFTVYGDHLSWCNSNGVAYQGAMYPGFAFNNTDTSKPKNQIKRMHGDFMWNQFAAAKNKGIAGVYISMFDEVQEATQIFKVAENSSMVPAGKYFLTLDADGVACSSDFYLRLTQDGGKMFKGQIGYTTSHPTSHTVVQQAVNNAQFVSMTATGSMTAGQTVSVNVVMKNTGSDTWTAAAGHSLGIAPTNNLWTIGGNRVALPGNTVSGANVTFMFNITAPATAGTYTFEMQMVDDIAPNQGWFGGKAAKQITVSAANQPPYFTSDPFAKPDATVGTAYDEPFSGQAGDPEGGTLTFSKVAGPEWMSVLSTGRAQGTPGSADAGTNSFVVKVTDAGGLSDTATMTINVLPAASQTVSFTSIGAEDGYLNESTETSNVGGGVNAAGTAGAGLRIGDTTTKQQHKSVVSFDTSSLPDGAVIQSATLKLMRGALSGTVTNLGLIKVDIKGSLGFNNASVLSKEDFEAAADATQIATMSYPSANGTLSTGSLNSTGLTKVNKTGRTQLRIYFAIDDNNDAVSDYLGFYPAENATVANRPVLEVTYQ